MTPALGFAAYSGTGKTTLLRQLIPLLGGHGLRVGMIKHAHHNFDIDHPGKDSYELRKAGAAQVLVASDTRRALITEQREPREPVLAELLDQLDHTLFDLVLVEGFRHEAFPKIELHRPAMGRELMARKDKSIIAIACDDRPKFCPPLPQLDLNSPAQIAEFVVDWHGKAVNSRE